MFKGKNTRLPKDLQWVPGVVVCFSSNGWLNDSHDWVLEHNHRGEILFTKHLIVWDAYRCHTSESTRTKLTKLGLHTAVIPGGCTRYVLDIFKHHADVAWNASFKACLRSLYEAMTRWSKWTWVYKGRKNELCSWVKKDWDLVPIEVLLRTHSSLMP